MYAADKGRIELEEFGEPLAIAFLGWIGGGYKERAVQAIVEARIRVVFGRGAGTGTRCVMGGGALRQQEESAPAPLMMGEEVLHRCRTILGGRTELQAEDEQPSKAASVLLRGKRNRKRHARGHRAIEVDHPLQLVRHKQIGAVWVNAGCGIGVRVGGGVGPC